MIYEFPYISSIQRIIDTEQISPILKVIDCIPMLSSFFHTPYIVLILIKTPRVTANEANRRTSQLRFTFPDHLFGIYSPYAPCSRNAKAILCGDPKLPSLRIHRRQRSQRYCR